MTYCSVNNHLIKSTVVNVVKGEIEDLEYLKTNIEELVNTLRTLLLGEYFEEFFDSFLEDSFNKYSITPEEFMQIPGLLKEIKVELNELKAIKTNLFPFLNSEIHKQNLLLLERLEDLETRIDNLT